MKKRRTDDAHRVIMTPLDGDAVPFGALELCGAPPSLNNLFLNVKKGRIKSPEYASWQVRAVLQLRKQAAWHVPGKIRVRLSFGRRDTRADLDNLIKPVLDLLMAAGRIADDRNVVEIAAAFETGVTGTRIEISDAAYIHKPGIGGRKHGDMWASVAAIGESAA